MIFIFSKSDFIFLRGDIILSRGDFIFLGHDFYPLQWQDVSQHLTTLLSQVTAQEQDGSSWNSCIQNFPDALKSAFFVGANTHREKSSSQTLWGDFPWNISATGERTNLSSWKC